MFVKRIKYTDYDGVEREEVFRFNFSKAEVLMMQFTTVGGMKEYLQKIIEEKDTKRIMETFRDLILKSYGEKSADGKRFEKSDELSTAFSQTEAFTVLLMDLMGKEGFAADFVNGIMPQVDVAEAGNGDNLVAMPQ